jgi:hypothetical protein
MTQSNIMICLLSNMCAETFNSRLAPYDTIMGKFTLMEVQLFAVPFLSQLPNANTFYFYAYTFFLICIYLGLIF